MRIQGLSPDGLPPSVYQYSQVVMRGYSAFAFNFGKHPYVPYHSN